MFNSIFASGVTPTGILAVLGAALVLGFAFAFLTKEEGTTNSFLLATGLLPMAVALVIALVNGSIGTGVAIAGAFGLVRFRSAQGSAREIATVFIAMAAGLALGMGYLGWAALFLLLSGVVMLVFSKINLPRTPSAKKRLRITVPEGLDYTELFDDCFAAYTKANELVQVKSAGLGSMFRLTYLVTLKDLKKEKEFLDALRVKNGNLEILSERADLKSSDL